jgi:hypothetical protein
MCELPASGNGLAQFHLWCVLEPVNQFLLFSHSFELPESKPGGDTSQGKKTEA